MYHTLIYTRSSVKKCLAVPLFSQVYRESAEAAWTACAHAPDPAVGERMAFAIDMSAALRVPVPGVRRESYIV